MRHNGQMSENFTISRADVKDGKMVTFGPIDPENMKRLSIPKTFTRFVDYTDSSLAVELQCVFDGEKIQVSRISVANSGGFVTSRDLTQLSLPAVIRQIGLEVIPDSEYWTQEWQDANSIKHGLKYDSWFIAQLYWFEHATWGSPRVAVQEFMGCKRTTANYYIRLAGEKTALPGQHKKTRAEQQLMRNLSSEPEEMPLEP